MTSQLNSLRFLFQYELMELAAATAQRMRLLPSMKAAASDQELKRELADQESVCRAHLEELSAILDQLQLSSISHESRVVAALGDDCAALLDNSGQADNKVLDAALIAQLQRMQHVELAGYHAAQAAAVQLHEHEHAQRLKSCQDEAEAAHRALEGLADRWILVVAAGN